MPSSHLFFGLPFGRIDIGFPLYANSEVNISHETTTVVVWIYDGI